MVRGQYMLRLMPVHWMIRRLMWKVKQGHQNHSTRSATSCGYTTIPAVFTMKQVTVRSGKGDKDRLTTLSAALIPLLQNHLTGVKVLHEQDLAAGYDGVFLDDAVEKKYPHAPKELIHQWFFPQKSLTVVAEPGELRRYHLHESKAAFPPGMAISHPAKGGSMRHQRIGHGPIVKKLRWA